MQFEKCIDAFYPCSRLLDGLREGFVDQRFYRWVQLNTLKVNALPACFPLALAHG